MTASPAASTRFQRFLLPGLAFKGVVIGGGYATGRELAEFFVPSGPQGGLFFWGERRGVGVYRPTRDGANARCCAARVNGRAEGWRSMRKPGLGPRRYAAAGAAAANSRINSSRIGLGRNALS